MNARDKKRDSVLQIPVYEEAKTHLEAQARLEGFETLTSYLRAKLREILLEATGEKIEL